LAQPQAYVACLQQWNNTTSAAKTTSMPLDFLQCLWLLSMCQTL